MAETTVGAMRAGGAVGAATAETTVGAVGAVGAMGAKTAATEAKHLAGGGETEATENTSTSLGFLQLRASYEQLVEAAVGMDYATPLHWDLRADLLGADYDMTLGEGRGDG